VDFDKLSFRPTERHKEYLIELSQRYGVASPSELMKVFLDDCIKTNLLGFGSDAKAGNDEGDNVIKAERRREVSYGDINRRRVDMYCRPGDSPVSCVDDELRTMVSRLQTEIWILRQATSRLYQQYLGQQQAINYLMTISNNPMAVPMQTPIWYPPTPAQPAPYNGLDAFGLFNDMFTKANRLKALVSDFSD
jgi:hypothetical protein